MALTHTPKGAKKKGKNMADGMNIADGNEDDPSRVLSVSEQLYQQKLRDAAREKKEFDVLLKKKETVARKLTRVEVALGRPEAADKHYLQLQLKMCDGCYGEYSDLQNRIYDLNTSEDVRCAEEMRFIEFEELYSALYVQITKKIEALSVKDVMEPVVPQPVHNHPYVPPLKAPLPTFDGNFENWFAFKNMFQNVMARYDTESPAIKLYHLRNSLVGAAAGVIDQDIINNNDYDAAWETLQERFEVRQVIVDKHIDAMFNIPAMTKESAAGLRKLIDTVSKNVDALKNLELPVEGLGEMVLLNVLVKKFDLETRKAWGLDQKDNELADFKSTMDFLKERCKVYEKISRSSKATAEVVKQVRPAGKTDSKVHSLVTTSGKCTHCKGDHEIWKCEVFKNANLSEKYNSLRKSGSCFNCMEKGHMTGKCKSERSCKQCGKRHHTSLHPTESHSEDSSSQQSNVASRTNTPKPSAEVGGPTTNPTTSGSVLCSNIEADQDTLLATAIAFVQGAGKRKMECRAVLDSASHKHFITEAMVAKLGLKRKKANYTIIGIGGNQIAIQHKVHARIKSKVSEYESPCLEFLVVKKITGDLPMQQFETAQLNIPEDIQLADAGFNVPGQVDVLIGSGLFFKLIKHGQLQLADHLPAVQETSLGWIVSGLIPTNQFGVGGTLCTMVTEDDVGKLLERFWYFDSYDETIAPEQSSADACISHFLETHRRDEDGRFVVRLPFNEAKGQLGDTETMARKRFYAVERRLDKDPDLKRQYVDFMKEYADLGHMVEITPPPNEDPTMVFYLPHHCVLKPTSSTTKLRVVFDGSAESSTGVSVNQTQMVGPTVQNDLVSIHLKFRTFQYAISADIPKMYRQVRIDDDFLRVFWRSNHDEPLKVYALKTVTYGLASSPFLATMALRQLAEEEEHRYPLAAKTVKKSCYIDDMLSGANSFEEAVELLRQVTGLLNDGGFDIHKVCSNSKELLELVPEAKRERLGVIDDAAINGLLKTLGLVWNPDSDVFTFRIAEVLPSAQLTKRVILSEISRIFDPLGFLGPVLTTAKLIMRELWLLELHWDDVLPQEFVELWTDFRERLQTLNGLEIPRCVLSRDSRSVFRDGKAEMRLVCSKSRILPKKQGTKKEVTTPRGELQAALLLSRLAVKLIGAMEIQFESVVLWSDSQIVLCWIKKSPDLLKIYVGNRVKEIQLLTNEFDWRYIPSKMNPADLISRGLQPNQLRGHETWWTGPECLKKVNCEIDDPPPIQEAVIPELRGVAFFTTNARQRMKIFDSVSRFPIMQRSMAYVIRFTDYIRSGRQQLTKGLPTADEMRRALLLIVRLTQKECFGDEIRALKEKDFKYPLKCLNPFIDENDDTLRVGGRIRHAQIPYGSKHQLLLPSRHPVTVAIVRHLHKTNMHVGQRALLAVVRQQFWPLRAKNVIRDVIHKCTPCYRANPKRATQLMGDLPEYRVQAAYPFANVGIDFAGPFTLRAAVSTRKSVMTKGYVCVFVCMATRAMHLEAVSNLSTDAFLGALQRFVSRRGLPNKIFSDNATNFVGANNELARLADLFNTEMHQKKLNGFCVHRNIEWSFIPPRSPHFGGIWEAGVKSAKFHLRPILADHKLSYEELATVLAQIEATLNSRPLIPSSDDPNDLTAITPAHFLIGREFQAVLEPSYDHVKPGRLSRWQVLQDLKQKYWRTWSTDFLQELQRRQRDFKTTKFKVGALVLIADDNLPPLQWNLARVEELHPGKDGHVRVVTL
ncbi:uncharacterized protein LOC109410486 [Aedes albopictus]|uniref:Endonuclease n=1 Tax=Aedes albopictus TaxID=7160 RepID=A0ABM1Z229_AEDAL